MQQKIGDFSRIRMPWYEQVNCVIYVLNIIIGALIDVSISTSGRTIAWHTLHFRRTHLQLGNLHSSLVGVQRTESAAFCNVDDEFVSLEMHSQHMICKLELIHPFTFHVNSLLYISWFLIVSAAMHLKILAYTWKCYKWHNHTSFCDYLSLDVVEEALKNKAFCH